MRPPLKARRDKNESEIFDILRGNGIQVHPIDVPCDAICGYNGVTYLVEVKNGSKARLTPAQIKFRDTWKGQYVVLCDAWDALAWAKGIRAAEKQ